MQQVGTGRRVNVGSRVKRGGSRYDAGAAGSARAQAGNGKGKKVLMMGGTRFIGVYLARMLVQDGHEVHLCTRGKAPIASQIPDDSDAFYQSYQQSIHHVQADRTDSDAVSAAVSGQGFDVVFDLNGRESSDAQIVIDALPNLEQYIFCSSAGVYLKSDVLPHKEEDSVDESSRHKGKLDTEQLLRQRSIPFTSVRPVYIYGPLNYNPVEEWFFDRIEHGRPVPVPGSGLQITSLGHVKDLACAFRASMSNPNAINQVYNITGERYVTFDGLVRACAQAMGKPEPEIVHYDPKAVDLGKSKAFPLRNQHFFASIDKAKAQLNWEPAFDLVAGLAESYQKDFKEQGKDQRSPDFSVDDVILDAVKAPAAAAA
jgi:nucleoside-diphosphate-sugar epimerase